ncbi:class I SAM-dependent methyltransferase [Ruegeria atlantica]|uniref:Demethylmenaquinone methyltransferase n=1 Tax=Ruegeria atlantica TaxID=81569 RepID=A0A0P1ENS3_9RHOB|nr:class I SAM-dependent methyltransferase [Ruegeria atlantica]CUH45067.1 Demethylmenaquinone methyltransferase [Ruegeria atlantica]
MSSNSASFIGEIPHHYDQGLGPNIFVDYADRLTGLCGSLETGRVLELAAGTGIVSRKLRNALNPSVSLTVSDLNPPMLEIAKAKFSGSENVEFVQANAMELPFEDNSFDLIVCQFGVMFFPDKTASYREAARVLKPGGRYVFNVWSDMFENPFSETAHKAAMTFFPENPPGFYKVPFHYGDPDVVHADLAAAGWGTVTHETIRLNKPIADLEKFATALVYGNPLIDEIRARGGVDPDAVVAEMLSALRSRFEASDMVMPLSATQFECRNKG